MIENERQFNVTSVALAKFQLALERLNSNSLNDPIDVDWITKAYRDALTSQIADLKYDIEAYNENK